MKLRRRTLIIIALLILLPAIPAILLCALSCRYAKGLAIRGKVGSSLQAPARHGRAHLDRTGDLAVLHLYGSPAEMGTQYGTILRPSLQALDRYLHAMVREDMRDSFIRFAREHETSLPEPLREELKAVSAACGVPYIDLVAINTIPRARCSALAAWGQATPDGEMIVGRNADYFSFGLGEIAGLLVVYHPDEGLPVASVSYVGMNSVFTGVNARGVTFANLLTFNAAGAQLDPAGVPIQCLLRTGGQRARTAADMRDALLKARHMMPINVIVADAREAFILELAPAGNRVRTAAGDWLAVTNHFRLAGTRRAETACPRYEALTEAVTRGPIGLEEMKRALYESRMKGLNLHCLITRPAAMRAWVSVNRMPASAGPWAALDLAALFDGRTNDAVAEGKGAPAAEH
jgi:hypothetical protein